MAADTPAATKSACCNINSGSDNGAAAVDSSRFIAKYAAVVTCARFASVFVRVLFDEASLTQKDHRRPNG